MHTTPNPKFNDPKTTRPCPKPHYKDPNNPTQEEAEKYASEVREWVDENVERKDGENGCWDWKGAFAPHSGGARYNNFAAHAFIYRLLRGDYDGNLLRVCRNKHCVNPNHASPRVGKRTKKKLEIERIVKEGSVVLKEEGRKEVVEGVKSGVREELRDIVKAEVRKLEKDIVEGVVAELVRIRFDEMVARAIREGK